MNELITRTPIIIAAEINSIKDQTRKIVLNNSIEIGRRLVEAKTLVAHGEWGNWLKDSVDYSQSTANNLMKIFEQYGADQFTLFGSEAKSQALGNLSYTQAVALLGVPEEEREAFVNDNEIGNMSTRELQEAIKENQKLKQQLKDSEAKAEKERIAHQKFIKQQEDLERKVTEKDELVQRLNEEIEEARNNGDDTAVEELKSELEKSKEEQVYLTNQVKQLEERLHNKPIDVPVIEYVEKIPDDLEAELKELRDKVAKQGDDSSSIKFKYHFDSIVSEFRGLLETLESITDFDVKEKYKSAVKGLISKMTENL